MMRMVWLLAIMFSAWVHAEGVDVEMGGEHETGEHDTSGQRGEHGSGAEHEHYEQSRGGEHEESGQGDGRVTVNGGDQVLHVEHNVSPSEPHKERSALLAKIDELWTKVKLLFTSDPEARITALQKLRTISDELGNTDARSEYERRISDEVAKHVSDLEQALQEAGKSGAKPDQVQDAIDTMLDDWSKANDLSLYDGVDAQQAQAFRDKIDRALYDSMSSLGLSHEQIKELVPDHRIPKEVRDAQEQKLNEQIASERARQDRDAQESLSKVRDQLKSANTALHEMDGSNPKAFAEQVDTLVSAAQDVVARIVHSRDPIADLVQVGDSLATLADTDAEQMHDEGYISRDQHSQIESVLKKAYEELGKRATGLHDHVTKLESKHLSKGEFVDRVIELQDVVRTAAQEGYMPHKGTEDTYYKKWSPILSDHALKDVSSVLAEHVRSGVDVDFDQLVKVLHLVETGIRSNVSPELVQTLAKEVTGVVGGMRSILSEDVHEASNVDDMSEYIRKLSVLKNIELSLHKHVERVLSIKDKEKTGVFDQVLQQISRRSGRVEQQSGKTVEHKETALNPQPVKKVDGSSGNEGPE